MQKVENYTGHPDESRQAQEQTINAVDEVTGEPNWLVMAKDAYHTSTDYFDANIRKRS